MMVIQEHAFVRHSQRLLAKDSKGKTFESSPVTESENMIDNIFFTVCTCTAKVLQLAAKFPLLYYCCSYHLQIESN